MNAIKRAFQNPFVLVAQGFVAGAILFFTTTAHDMDPAASQPSAQIAAAVKNLGA